MARYDTAARDVDLSQLIDEALAGEEVIVARAGKPTVRLTVVAQPDPPERTQAEWMEWLRERRERRAPLGIDGAELVRQMRDEGAH